MTIFFILVFLFLNIHVRFYIFQFIIELLNLYKNKLKDKLYLGIESFIETNIIPKYYIITREEEEIKEEDIINEEIKENKEETEEETEEENEEKK